MKKIIEKLIYYAEKKLYLSYLDSLYVRNNLLARYNISEPYQGVIDKKEIDSYKIPDKLIDELKVELSKLDVKNVDSEICYIFGLLSPRPSEVASLFESISKKSKKKATDMLYDLSIANYYIQKAKVDKNIPLEFSNGLKASINLAKPEKSNKDIKKALETVSTTYPKCVLCSDNIGFFGNQKFQPRQNIRVIPLKLKGEDWFFQYSPYSYYYHHFIVIKDEHIPMHIDKKILENLVEFVDYFPYCFIGSNSDLPITGGSILTHEHFQGGECEMPLFKAHDRKVIVKNSEIKVSILDWPNSVVLFESENKIKLIDSANRLLKGFLTYRNDKLNIIPITGATRHASITPIIIKENKKYRLFVVLRNNRTDENHPDGIFHAEKKYQHIKKEGIGLIECMGLFVLPARLKRELDLIRESVNKNLSVSEIIKENEEIAPYQELIIKLKNTEINKQKDVINDYLGEICKNILINTALFKADKYSQDEFEKFLLKLELEKNGR